MLFYVWFEFTSWLRGVGQGKGVWDRCLTIWARQLCLCLYYNGKINDYWEIEPLICKWFVLARCGFVRFIALRCMFIWCFVSTCKSSSSNSVYKIPCKNDLERSSMTADNNTCHRIKKFCWRSNPKSPGLLFWVFYFKKNRVFNRCCRVPDRVPASSPEKLQAKTKICIFLESSETSSWTRIPRLNFSLNQKGCGECAVSIPKEPKTSVSSVPSEKS